MRESHVDLEPVPDNIAMRLDEPEPADPVLGGGALDCGATADLMRTGFLAVYDYGTGGGRAYLLADSAAQIRERFPGLHLVADRPNWLTDEEDQHLRERLTIDIDDAENRFLATLLQQRT